MLRIKWKYFRVVPQLPSDLWFCWWSSSWPKHKKTILGHSLKFLSCWCQIKARCARQGWGAVAKNLSELLGTAVPCTTHTYLTSKDCNGHLCQWLSVWDSLPYHLAEKNGIFNSWGMFLPSDAMTCSKRSSPQAYLCHVQNLQECQIWTSKTTPPAKNKTSVHLPQPISPSIISDAEAAYWWRRSEIDQSLRPHRRRSSFTIFFAQEIVHATLSLRTEGVFRWPFSPRAQNAIPEWGSTMGGTVGARRGFFDFAARIWSRTLPETGTNLSRILSWNRAELFSPFYAKSTPLSGPQSKPILETFISMVSLDARPWSPFLL